MPPNKLDEISVSIGGLIADSRSLKEAFNDHCDDDDRRHRENLDALEKNSEAINSLARALGPIAETINAWKPIIDSYQTSRIKLGFVISLAITILGLVGWVAEQIFINGIHWLFTRGHS